MAEGHTDLPALPAALESAAKRPAIISVDLLAQAGRAALARHAAKLYSRHDDALKGDDERAVHQMRVATRRMRAVLGATGEVFRPKGVKPIEKPLRRLAQTLGMVRDGDVFLEHLLAYRNALPPDDQGDFDVFIKRVQAERDDANATLRHELASKRYRHLLDELTTFVTVPLKDVMASDNGLPILVRYRASSACWSRYEAVRRFETILPTATSEQLHALRIACKHLRYTLEFFDSVLATEAEGLLRPVRDIQEQLGDIHDADVAVVKAQAHLYKEGTVPVILRYIEVREAARNTSVMALPPLWATLTDESYRLSLGRALAAL